MWKLGVVCRLLAFCGIILPFCLIYVLKFSLLSTLLLCVILGVSTFILKTATKKLNNGVQSGRIPPIKTRVKSHEQDESELAKNNDRDSARIISPVYPYQRSPLKRAEYVQRSGYSGHRDDSYSPKSKSYAPSPPILTANFIVPKTFSNAQSPGNSIAYASPVFSSPDKNLRHFPATLGLARSPLSSVRLSAASTMSTANSSSVNLSPQHHFKFTPRGQSRVPDHTKPAMFPLSSRHYPTHQPDYTRTSMGILPASSIFYGDGAAAGALSPLRRGGHLRTHSPVTVKIARPDNRRSASPLFRRLSMERASGSPLHKDAVIAALNEKRKRVVLEEQDDSSSMASSAIGVEGLCAVKRRRLDDGSRCSTPSVSMSSAASAPTAPIIGGNVPESSANAFAESRESWTGARGLQSRTPRNPIDSSISSSRRVALANQTMRKRLLVRPATPECSPSKKPLPPDDEDRTLLLPAHQPRSATTAAVPGSPPKEREGSDQEDQGGSGRGPGSATQEGTPPKAPARNPLAARLKTPRLKTLAHQMLKQNGSPPREYTAADLKEDRHRDEQKVGYILDFLKDEEEEVQASDKTKGQQSSKTVSFAAAPEASSIAAGPTTTSAALSSSDLLQLSKMKTLPVSALEKGQLLLGPKSDGDGAAKDKRPPAQDTGAPATSSQLTGTALGSSGALDLSKMTRPTTGFLTAGGSMAPASSAASTPAFSSASGPTPVDSSSRSGFTLSSQVEPASKEAARSSPFHQKDAILKGILAGKDEPSKAASAASAVFQLAGAPSNVAAPGPMSAGKQFGTDQAGLGQASSGQSLSGLLSQGTPTGGFSLASGSLRPQTSQGGLALPSATQQNGTTTGSSLLFQTPAAASGASSVASKSSGFQLLGTSESKLAQATSGPIFGSASNAAPSTFQFGAASQAPQSNTAAGLQSPMGVGAPVATVGTGGINFGTAPLSSSDPILKAAGQSSASLQFGGISSTTAKSAAPTLSFGAGSGSIGGQFGAISAAATSGLFSATTAASGSLFGGTAAATANAATAKPSFAPAFTQAVLAPPSQPAAPSFNFAAQPAGTAGPTAGGFQFKPAFGAPPQPQPSQAQAQLPGKPALIQHSNSMDVPAATSGLAAASGGFTASALPASSSSSIFGAAASGSPFQSAASGTAGGIFGQLPTTQPPSFATATAQPVNAFGATLAGQNVFGAQSTAPATTAGGFSFGAPPAAQANPPSFSFGSQPTSQPAAGGGMFQFGQQAGTNQPVDQPMGGFSTPSKPVDQPMGGFSTPSKPSPFSFGAGAGAGSGFGTPAPSFGTPAPSFGAATTPANPANSFSLGQTGAMPSQKRTSRMTRQARQTRRR